MIGTPVTQRTNADAMNVRALKGDEFRDVKEVRP
jgi:hypothetical protein